MNKLTFSDGIPIGYISDSSSLRSLCEEWRNEPFLAIDTEFERTNTFYAKIGLLQIADSKSCYLIDPLAIDDWSAFTSLLRNPDCTFVIHSCSEDLNLLQTFLGCLPVSLFDTQIAAAFLGIGFSISYQGLVEELLGVAVTKDETRSDWIKRPLSEKQIVYAATDVRYLLQLQDLLSSQIQEKERTDWLRFECSQLISTAASVESEANWESYYTAISNAWRLDDAGLEILQRLCYWREQKARKKNMPRSWIVKDNDLLNLSSVISSSQIGEGSTMDAVANSDTVNSRFWARNGRELLAMLAEESRLRKVDQNLLNKPLTTSLRKKLKRCQQAANAKAEQLLISPELLGRRKYLLGLMQSYVVNGEFLWFNEGFDWRRQFLEAELNAIMRESI